MKESVFFGFSLMSGEKVALGGRRVGVGAVSAAGATSSAAAAPWPPTTPCAAGARLPAAQTLSCLVKLLQSKTEHSVTQVVK